MPRGGKFAGKIFRACRNEDGDYRDVVSGLVKVLEVESVVPDLISSARRESVFSDLELEHKQDVPKDENYVDSFAETRHGELEEYPALSSIWL